MRHCEQLTPLRGDKFGATLLTGLCEFSEAIFLAWPLKLCLALK
jgi:hypothetical protein